ncbi:MAG: hypothetical protein CVU05_00415 [Bacteroidetes bacterium HGW-Bacteroidetes-21]|nr:MAG: hypothetical protein CVU05_00415 [Bacteroidetes bacterium HGW-Bacteroidetes-21]
MTKYMRTFLLLILISITIHLSSQNYHVIGAGHADANGTYVYSGEINGYPNWTFGNYSLHFTNEIGCMPKWVIMNVDTMIYKNYDWIELPPIDNWQVTCYSGSIFPAPQVWSDYPNLLWQNYSYQEDNSNSGSISLDYSVKIIMRSINGQSFTGNENDDYISQGKATGSNVPEGLTMQVVKINDSLLEVSFAGNALFHKVINSVYNIGICLHNNATTIGDSLLVQNNSFQNISINFKQPNVSKNFYWFYENSTNDGTIDNSVAKYIKLNRYGGETFSGTIGEDFYQTEKVTFSTLHQGITPELILINDTLISVRILGAAIAHNYDLPNVSVNFTNEAFSGNDAYEIYGIPFEIGFDFLTEMINNDDISNKPNFYPNPATDYLYFNTDFIPSTIEIYSIDGTLIQHMNSTKNNVNISSIQNGFYLIKMTDGSTTRIQKLVVRKIN